MTEGEKYELLVKELLRIKISADSGSAPQIRHRDRLKGASGQSYEFDLSFTTTLVGTRLLVVVECKCYSEPVGQSVVTDFAYKLRDIGAHKGIIVSTAEFTDGARTIAVREGIALVVARNAWTVAVFFMTGRPAPYVLYNQDRSSFAYPKGTDGQYAGPPVTGQIYARIDESPQRPCLEGPQLCFKPALAGFSGGPFGLFQASGIFLIENEVSSGELLEMHRYF